MSAVHPSDTMTLDAALDRVSGLDVPPPSPFVNHAPMACEVLVALGRAEALPTWSDHYSALLTPGAVPVEPQEGERFDWEAALGDHRRLPGLLGHFGRAIEDDGWEPVVAVWVPRLVPGLSAALFHGVIRTAHAVRALGVADTPTRRAELARGLGLWASWWRPGSDDLGPVRDDDLRGAVVASAADGARAYLADPSIFNLHGVTGAMAVDLLVDHLRPADGAAALGILRSEHALLYGSAERIRPFGPDGEWHDGVADSAAASLDPHQVKLVEACRRGYTASADGAFAAASRLVVGGS